MIDIYSMQYSFWLHWAEMYLKGSKKFWNYVVDLFYKNVGCRSAFKSNVNANEFKGIEKIQSIFWKNVLITWLNHNRAGNMSEEPIHKFSPIFNNFKIIYRNETLFIPTCLQ